MPGIQEGLAGPHPSVLSRVSEAGLFRGPGLLTLLHEVLERYRTTPRLSALALWSRQAALLLRAGLTLAETLDTLRHEPEDAGLRRLTRELYQRILAGELLSPALAAYPHAFPPQVRGLLRASEESGSLPEGFDRLAVLAEREADLRRRLFHATLYPWCVGAVTLALCLLLTIFIVPQFGRFYNDFSGGEAQLPLLTRRVLHLAAWLATHWSWLLASPLVCWLLGSWRNSALGRRLVDPWQLRLPLFGLITRKAETARCARGLAALLAAGIPLDTALRLAADCTVNIAVRRGFNGVLRRISAGAQLASALRREPVFAPLVASMVAVTSNVAAAAHNLELLADAYDADIDRSLKVILRQLEPSLLAFIGLYVGTVAVSLYLPLFNLVDVIQ